jgi:uncharacterized protein (DUF305 family)
MNRFFFRPSTIRVVAHHTCTINLINQVLKTLFSTNVSSSIASIKGEQKNQITKKKTTKKTEPEKKTELTD